MSAPAELLEAWIRRRVDAAAAAWLEAERAKLEAGASDRDFYLAVSYVPRKLGKADLALDAADLAAAAAARDGWDPSDWSVDQAGRVAMILAGGGAGEAFVRRLTQLFVTADLPETIAFYRGLPLYPDQDLLIARAHEGARSGMKPIFEAVAHKNPYPLERFDEASWNQMVLKALFIETTLWPIQGLDVRANPELSIMLSNYAHERWAAGRPVSPELWRCLGPYADEAGLDDLARVLAEGGEKDRKAAALALRSSPDARAAAMLDAEPGLKAMVERGEIAWPDLA